MAAVTMLKRSAPTGAPLSPERETLARRIAARDTALVRLAGLRGVADRGNEAVWRARDAVTAAEEAARAAPAIDAKAAATALIAGEPQPVPTSAAARAALTTAEETLDAAIFARDSVHTEIAELERGESNRARDVADAIGAVVRAEMMGTVLATIAEVDSFNRQAADKMLAIRALMRANCITDSGPDAVPGLLTQTVRFHNMALQWPFVQQPEASPTAAAWAAALAALRNDPAAPVPK